MKGGRKSRNFSFLNEYTIIHQSKLMVAGCSRNTNSNFGATGREQSVMILGNKCPIDKEM
jgi:hypothetical protein